MSIMSVLYWPISYLLTLAKMHLLLFALLKLEKRITKRSLVCYVAVLVLVTIIPILYENNLVPRWVLSTTPYFGALFVTLTGLKNKKHYALGFIIFLSASFFETILAGLIYGALNLNVVAHLSYHAQNIFIEILSASIMLFFIYVARIRKASEREFWLNSKYSFGLYFFLLSFISLSMYIIPLQYDYLRSDTRAAQLLIGLPLSSLIFIIANVVTYISIIKSEQLRSKNQLYETILEQQKQYYTNMLDKDEKIHRIRHDIESHLLTVSNLLANKEHCKAEEYINTLYQNTHNELNSNMSTGNRVLDMLLHQFTDDSHTIPLVVEGKIPNQLNIIDIDLCILFSNLLKNAYAAASESLNGSIHLLLQYTSGNIMVTVINSISTAVRFENGKPVRRNGDHGFGTRNIEDVVKKYNGYIDYTANETQFTANIMLLNAF